MWYLEFHQSNTRADYPNHVHLFKIIILIIINNKRIELLMKYLQDERKRRECNTSVIEEWEKERKNWATELSKINEF